LVLSVGMVIMLTVELGRNFVDRWYFRLLLFMFGFAGLGSSTTSIQKRERKEA